MKNKTLEMLRAAREKKRIEIVFEIPLGDTKLKAMLCGVDKYRLAEKIDVKKSYLYKEYCKDGLDKKSFDELEWQKDLANYKDAKIRERVAKEPPANLAEQKADKWARIYASHELIPQYLRDPETKEVLLDEESQKVLREIAEEDTELQNLLTENFLKLFRETQEVAEEAKNS